MMATHGCRTKIFYYLDEEDQPYVAHTEIPVQHVTLGDVKKLINRPNYKFFFRNHDPDMGPFKDEITDDSATVPYCSKGNRIVVHLVSLDGSVRSESNSVGSGSTKGLLNTQRLRPAQQVLRDPKNTIREPHYATLGRVGPMRVPLQNTTSYPNAGYETESVTSITQSSYSDSEFDGSSRVSSMTEATHISRMKKKRKKMRMPSMYRASSMSSIADTVVSDNIIKVSFDMDSGPFLGIRLPEYDHPTASGPLPGVYVASIMEDSIVHLDGRINAGDMILKVNGISLSGMTNEQAIQALREAAKKPHITLVVAKGSSSRSSTSYSSGSYQSPYIPPYAESSASSTTYTMESYQEPAKPIDPAAWAQQTTNFLNQYDIRAPSSLHFGGNKIANGFPFLGNASSQNCELSTDSDLTMIIQQMAKPDSGLDIRDRMWLKIPIPRAFMGKDLVKWLRKNVKNISSSSDAKKFASKLLSVGYIRHTVGKMNFSEQAYYTFRLEPEQLSSDFANMSVVGSEVDYDDEILESVSQVAANRAVYAEPDYRNGHDHRRVYAPREGRTGSGHSSGGSGYGSDRQKKPALSSTTETSQVTQVFNPPLPTLLNLAPSAVDSNLSHQSYRNAVRKPYEQFSAHL